MAALERLLPAEGAAAAGARHDLVAAWPGSHSEGPTKAVGLLLAAPSPASASLTVRSFSRHVEPPCAGCVLQIAVRQSLTP